MSVVRVGGNWEDSSKKDGLEMFPVGERVVACWREVVVDGEGDSQLGNQRRSSEWERDDFKVDGIKMMKKTFEVEFEDLVVR